MYTDQTSAKKLSIGFDWLIDRCFKALQHKIDQFVPIYQGDYWLRRLRIANEEHTNKYSSMRYNEHTQKLLFNADNFAVSNVK